MVSIETIRRTNARATREMEALLRRLAGEPAQPILETNPNFDVARFTELEE